MPAIPADSVVLDNGTRVLRVYRDRTISIQGKGFAPGTEVEVWINSTPIKLGTALTDANGEFNEIFTTPIELELGEHTLTLSGGLEDGNLSKTSIGIVVVDVEELGFVPSVDIGITASEITSGPGGEPYDPKSDSKKVVGLLGNAVGLMALAGLASANRQRKRDDEDTPNSEDDEGHSSNSVSHKTKESSLSVEDRADALRLPRSAFVDRLMSVLPVKLARVSPLAARVFVDGT